MPKGSPELTQARREEIINACAQLYENMGFKDITLKEIANFTSFTRPSIYNYFQTKEEIFLALMQREYEVWTKELNSLQPSGKSDRRLELADALAHTLERREQLLKLLSTNLTEMEDNSRMERLVEFKRVFGGSINAVRECLGRFMPEMSEGEKDDFISAFFPFVYGIYPYAAVTDKQKEAMALANISYRFLTIYEIAFIGTKGLLGH